MTKFAVAACAALLLLTGCGGGGDEDEAKENIKAGLLEQDSGLAGTEVTEEQAQCVSDGLVDDIGVDKLQEYGVLEDDLSVDASAAPENVDAEDADTLASVIIDCVDFKEVMTEQMGATADLTDEQKTCLSDAIDEEALKDLLSAGFQGEEPEMGADMQADMMKCMTPSGG